MQTSVQYFMPLLARGRHNGGYCVQGADGVQKDTGEPNQYRVVKKGVEKPVADAILAYADSYRLKDGAAVDTSLQTEEKEDKKDGEAKTGKATRILYLTSEQAASRTYPYGEFLGSVIVLGSLGSNCSRDAIARIAPVLTFMTMALPRPWTVKVLIASVRYSSTMDCTFSSMVRFRLLPSMASCTSA